MAWRKWPLVGLVVAVTVCLLVVGIAAWKNREFAPGTLPEVAQIPTHDRELEGQTVTVSLTKTAKNAGEELPFVYVWQPELETGYLVCFDLSEDAVTEVTVYQPKWQGLEGLCGAIQEAFSAAVVRQLNISAQEGHYMRGVTAFRREYHEKLLPEEVVDIYNVQESSQGGTRVYLGMLMTNAPQGHYATRREDGSYVEIMEKSHYTSVEGGYLYLTGNAVSAASAQLQEQIGVFRRIMERFDVEEIIGNH